MNFFNEINVDEFSLVSALTVRLFERVTKNLILRVVSSNQHLMGGDSEFDFNSNNFKLRTQTKPHSVDAMIYTY